MLTVVCIILFFFLDVEQGAGSREQGAGSREQGAGSREQRAESREQRAESREQRAESREQVRRVPGAIREVVLRVVEHNKWSARAGVHPLRKKQGRCVNGMLYVY